MTVAIVIIVVILLLAVAGTVVFLRRRSAPPLAEPGIEERAPEAPQPAGVTVEEAPSRLRTGLTRTRRALADRLDSLFGRDRLDADFWADLEDTLVAADVGIGVATDVVERVRSTNPQDPAAARGELRRQLVELLEGADRALHLDSAPAVILVVGVNGTGKTTSIAKIAARLQQDGTSVILAAADTFRAAADEQLRTWANRVGVQVVGAAAGSDPASVAYDAYQEAKSTGIDAIVVDTAGRLQTKSNLMDELSKVARVLRREAGTLDEVLLVLDGTTGQNAIAQAKGFTEAVGVTGVVVTKLDGTARGGVAVAVERELGIPVKFIGVGEGVADLLPFRPEEFVDALVSA